MPFKLQHAAPPSVAFLALLTAFAFLLFLSGFQSTDRLARQVKMAEADSVPRNLYAENWTNVPTPLPAFID